MQELTSWVDAHFAKIQSDWFTFLRFQSISTDPAKRQECDACAEWVKHQLHDAGCKAELIPTSGLPLVYAEDLSAGPNAPTLLIYGHYDVQPIDPIELWESPPFEPVIKNGTVYARGAQDDKGQIFYAIAALRALNACKRKRKVNLKFCIEGEEEKGSEGLASSIESLKQKLSADSLLVVDFGMLDAKTPAISLGARGIITMEVTLRGSEGDLHSGTFGGIAYNPNRALVELLNSCWDHDGKVQVPHFYDDVVMPSSSERALFKDLKHELPPGLKAVGGEKGFTPVESAWLRPTLEINGMAGGYFGPGFKTVIPSTAQAKISCRLVPNQDPDRIGKLVADFLRAKVKKGIEIHVEMHHGGKPYRGSSDSLLAKATEIAYEEVCGCPCKRILAGGSIPVIAQLMQAIDAEVVGMGYGLDSDQIHAPNEHFEISRFRKGILTVARIIEILGEKTCLQSP